MKNKGFGISLSQFFAEDQNAEMTCEFQELYALWVKLTPEQKNAAAAVIRAFSHDQP